MVHKYMYLYWISFEGGGERIVSHGTQKNFLCFKSINVLSECASWKWVNVMIGLGYQKLDSEMSSTGNMCRCVSVRECSETLTCGMVT